MSSKFLNLLWIIVFIVTSFITEVHAADKGLAGYWTFDEGKGKTVIDYSGHNCKGTIIGGATWADGKLGKCLFFNGTDSYVDIPDGDWNNGAPFTVMCWVKYDPSEDGKSHKPGGMVLEHMFGGGLPGLYTIEKNGKYLGFALYDSKITEVSVGVKQTDEEESSWVFMTATCTDKELALYQNGEFAGKKSLDGMPKFAGRLSVGARGCAGDRFFRGWIDEVAIYDRVLDAKEIESIYQNYNKSVGLTNQTGIQVVDLVIEKIFYQPDEKGMFKVTVNNFSNSPQEGTLSVKLVSLINKERQLCSIPVKMDPLECKTIEVPLTFAGESYGCELVAEIKQEGEKGASVRQFFSVSDTLWKVGIGGPLAPAQAGSMTPKQIAEKIYDLRNGYANWLEMFFWPPDDWGDLVPKRDWWYSGQANYLMHKESIKGLINEAHKHGIKAITYGKSTACGAEGWEIARRHPEWFNEARPSGVYDVYSFDNWNNEEMRKNPSKYPDFRPTWMWLFPDMRKKDAVDWGITQLILSSKEYGWDGIRYDGHYTASDDELSTFNMRRLKEQVWKNNPSFLLGFNYAYSPEHFGGINHEMREGMAGGGMWMQEAIGGNNAYTQGKQYTSWKHFAENELKVAKEIQSLGGTYHCIYKFEPNDPRGLYKLIYGLISGGHSIYGSHSQVMGCGNWGKFMTRWSAFLWHQNLVPVKQVDERVAVETVDPIFWKPLTQEFVESSSRKFLVVHLVNPPTTDDINSTTMSSLPLERKKIIVKVKPENGTKILSALWIRPEKDPYEQELEIAVSKTWSQVVVPELAHWGIVVFELDGKFTVPASTPRFSTPPDQARVAAAMTEKSNSVGANDPLKPALKIPLKPNEIIWDTTSGAQNINCEIIGDTGAAAGMAQCQPKGPMKYMGKSWVGPLPEGRYRISFHIKWVGNPPTGKVRVEIKDHHHAVVLSTKVFNFDDAEAPATPGKYLYRYIDVDQLTSGCIQCYMNVLNAQELGPDDKVYLDYIKTEQLERFSDQMLLEKGVKVLEKPADLRQPSGHAPKNVLLVKGLYWQQYGIEKAVNCKSTYKIPETYEEMYANDAVVLCNMDLTYSNLAVRKLLREFVEDGGRLVILGGYFSLGPGGFMQTFLDDIMPYAMKGPLEIVKCPSPLLLGAKPNMPYTDRPALFWRHDLAVKEGARVLAYAGQYPIASRQDAGKGQVDVFAGTVLGEGSTETEPFWQCESWQKLARELILE